MFLSRRSSYSDKVPAILGKPNLFQLLVSAVDKVTSRITEGGVLTIFGHMTYLTLIDISLYVDRSPGGNSNDFFKEYKSKIRYEL